MKVYIIYQEWVYEEWETLHTIKVFSDEEKAREEFERVKQEIKSHWENREDLETEEIDTRIEYSCWYDGDYLYHHDMVRFEEKEII